MIVSDENKFAFVCIAKAASTSIRKRFGFVATAENPDPPPHIYHMFLKDIFKQRPESKEYFKFCFVRNPYDRLYSTYADFKYSLGHYWAKEAKEAKNFKDFVMNIPGSSYSNWIHLQPQVDYITVDGKIAVDYMGRVENLVEDFREVERKLCMPHVPLSKVRFSPKVDTDPKIYDDEMKSVVTQLYKKDFEILGYEQ